MRLVADAAVGCCNLRRSREVVVIHPRGEAKRLAICQPMHAPLLSSSPPNPAAAAACTTVAMATGASAPVGAL